MPVKLALGADPKSVEANMQRSALDRWLNAPFGRDAAAEKALLRFLGVAS